jgi:hypothetical protein
VVDNGQSEIKQTRLLRFDVGSSISTAS